MIEVELTPELKALQGEWLALAREGRDAFYATRFAEPFARVFAELPLDGAPPGLPRPRGLISVLGFSWQPVALMAAWARPERMLLLGTKESLGLTVAGEDVVSLISRVAGLDRRKIAPQEIGDPGEAEIYRAVRDFLQGFAPREIFVDPTGGKKSMSASTALAAFLVGAPVVYVDYGKYDGPRRIPIAGTEYPRLLSNPLDVLGDLERRQVFAAFDRSDFREAAHFADRLADRVYEPREAQALGHLARGYEAWHAFDFSAALEHLGRARESIGRFAREGRWSWAPPACEALDRNLGVLRKLDEVARKERPESIEDAVPLLLTYLAAASRMIEANRTSLAVLLTYTTVERYVDLCLGVEEGVDVDQADLGSLAGRLDPAMFKKAGKLLFGDRFRPLEPHGPIMFGNGVQILATLGTGRVVLDDLGTLQGLSRARNACEYQHGWIPRRPGDRVASLALQKARELVARLCGGEEALARSLEDHRFPHLGSR